MAMSCGVGHRCGSDLELLWLWWRPAVAVPIGPLAWEPPYVKGAVLEMAKRQKKKRERERTNPEMDSHVHSHLSFDTGAKTR